MGVDSQSDHTAITATAGSEKLTKQTEYIPALYRDNITKNVQWSRTDAGWDR